MNDAYKTFLDIQNSDQFTPEKALEAFRAAMPTSQDSDTTIDEDDTSTRNWIVKRAVVDLISQGDVSITFTKKDGTERNLVATSRVPAEKLPKGPGADATEEQIERYEATQRKMNENSNLLRVFDLEKQDWRSVNVDTIKYYTLLNTGDE